MEQKEEMTLGVVKVTRKWVARPLSATCGVCSSPASEVQHYGAIACYSCRAFFRRSIQKGNKYSSCSRKTDSCHVDSVSRANCMKCRLKKCLENGMIPDKVDRIKKRKALNALRENGRQKDPESEDGTRPEASDKSCTKLARIATEVIKGDPRDMSLKRVISESSHPNKVRNCSDKRRNVICENVDITSLIEQCVREPIEASERLVERCVQQEGGGEQLDGSQVQKEGGCVQLEGDCEPLKKGCVPQEEGGVQISEQFAGGRIQLERDWVLPEGGCEQSVGGRVQHDGGCVQQEEGCLQVEGNPVQQEGGCEQLKEGTEQLAGVCVQLEGGCVQIEGGCVQMNESHLQQEGGCVQQQGGSVQLNERRSQLEIGQVHPEGDREISNRGHHHLKEGQLQLQDNLVNLSHQWGSVMPIQRNPEFDLTFEEDFKIHELIVRKENVLDTMLSLVIELTNFKETATNFSSFPVSSVESTPLDEISKIMVKEQVLGDIAHGGILRQSLEMFDDQRMVDDRVKSETFSFTVSVMQLCLRAFLLENRDQGSFVEQHLAAGAFNLQMQNMYDHFFPGDRTTLKSFNPLATAAFLSPWAVRPEDEEFFTSTLTVLGKVVGQDTKLGTLFYTLVLFTPGAKLSQMSRKDQTLKKVQNETAVLIFRYLKMKYLNTQYAVKTTNLLLKLVGDLHMCLHIHLHCRRAPLHGRPGLGWARGQGVMQSILAFNSAVMTSLPQCSK